VVEIDEDYNIINIIKIITCCANCGDYTIIDISEVTDDKIKKQFKENL
tara:strand:- start:227 stop:370 length:144 start_codon:yes stop_codon:yes gene_type:complete